MVSLLTYGDLRVQCGSTKFEQAEAVLKKDPKWAREIITYAGSQVALSTELIKAFKETISNLPVSSIAPIGAKKVTLRSSSAALPVTPVGAGTKSSSSSSSSPSLSSDDPKTVERLPSSEEKWDKSCEWPEEDDGLKESN